ncbi:MAG: hypothetical protein JST71_11290 [Bacteroidetes bacterium]|nr:hypothetical protein [Bacteroidota bacterium]HMU76736.1 hypothetical protein [Bacteroidia bacterium]MCW5918366.1 hypothetical protein [Bacteroidota bacterium]HMW10164.1 hypothetical protein [Bacteroidia bacterium]HNB32477.1 hypothetical protein [Bacteroidia bacterium]
MLIIRLFKSSQTPPLFLVPVITLLLVLFNIYTQGVVIIKDMNHGVLYALLLDSKIDGIKWAVPALIFVLITIQAYLFNTLINRFEVLYKNSNIPVIIFIILYGLIPDFLSLSPFILVNTLMPLALWKIFALYKSERPVTRAFDTGFVFSLMILCYLPMALLVVFMYLCIAILRPFNWREWVASALGLATPAILLFTILLVTNKMHLRITEVNTDTWLPVIKLQSLSWHYILPALVIAVILFLSFLKLYANYSKNVIRMRKFQLCFMLLLVFLLLIILIPVQQSAARFSLLIPPICLFLSYYFIAIRKIWWFEILSTVFILLIALGYAIL